MLDTFTNGRVGVGRRGGAADPDHLFGEGAVVRFPTRVALRTLENR